MADTIRFWIEKGYFDDPKSHSDLVLAINELDVLFKYGSIQKAEYERLREELLRKVTKKGY